jgi:cytochrome oxidase Cu insertion factor (SCO1/SenC/PrrC family)
MRQARIIVALLVLIVGAGGFWVAVRDGYFGPMGGSKSTTNQVQIGGAFELTDHWGDRVTEATYQGTYMLVFFGYTFCPDVCPTTLSTISSALDELGSDADKISPLFVTVDPERDTPEYLREYIEHFHPAITGLSGNPNQIKKIAKGYGVYYAKAQEEGADPDDYLMDHTSITYLMDGSGAYVTHFSHDIEASAMANKIKSILAGGG